jgi:hypothetical protein
MHCHLRRQPDPHRRRWQRGSIDYTGTDASAFVHSYNAPGVFVAKAFNENGVQTGSATITVAYVRLPKAIACQVGYTRTVDIHTGHFDPAGLVITTNDPNPTKPALIKVARGDAVDNHLRIRLTALARGTPVIHVRQGSPTGPILAMKEVDEFTIDSMDMQQVMIDDETRRSGGGITMRPFVPDLGVDWNFFANKISFEDGNPNNRGSSNSFTRRWDATRGEYVADGIVEFFVPRGEDKFCVAGTFTQTVAPAGYLPPSADTDAEIGEDPKPAEEALRNVPVGHAGQLNGDGSSATMAALILPVGTDENSQGQLEIIIVQEGKTEESKQKKHRVRLEPNVKGPTISPEDLDVMADAKGSTYTLNVTAGATYPSDHPVLSPGLRR